MVVGVVSFLMRLLVQVFLGYNVLSIYDVAIEKSNVPKGKGVSP